VDKWGETGNGAVQKWPRPLPDRRQDRRTKKEAQEERVENDQAHLPGPLQEIGIARNRNAAPVRCSIWFGMDGIDSANHPMSQDTLI